MTEDPNILVPRRFFAKAMAFEIGLGVLAIALGSWFPYNPLAPLRPPAESSGLSLTIDVLWGVMAAIPLITALWIVDHFPVGPFRSLKELTENFIVPLFATQQLWQLLLLSAAAGFGEELLFRGLVQAGLAKWLTVPLKEIVAWLGASIFFGVCHWLSPTYAIVATLMGLYLGGLYLVTGSLLPPMIAHGLYDFVALAYFLRRRR